MPMTLDRSQPFVTMDDGIPFGKRYVQGDHCFREDGSLWEDPGDPFAHVDTQSGAWRDLAMTRSGVLWSMKFDHDRNWGPWRQRSGP